MRRYAIMREPGRRARAGRSSPHPRRMAVVEALTPRHALEEYIAETYRPGHRQYDGHHIAGGKSDRANPRAVVTLANGVNVHEVVLRAWPLAKGAS